MNQPAAVIDIQEARERRRPSLVSKGSVHAVYRPAGATAHAAIFELLQEMYSEVGFFTMSETKIKEQITDIIARGVSILAMCDDKLVGSIGLIPTTMWWSDEVVLSERWIFVSADYRRSTIAKDMFRLVNDFATQASLTLVIGVFSPKQVVRKGNLFRRFFKPVGEIFIGGKTNVLR